MRSQREIGFTFDYCVRLVEGHQRVYLRDVREPSQVGPDSDGTWVLCAMSVASYEALCKRLIAIWNSEYHLVSDEERQAAHASAN